MNNAKDKDYLGDGVYVGHDGYQIWLWTSDGITVSNTIALDPTVYEALVRYAARTAENRSA